MIIRMIQMSVTSDRQTPNIIQNLDALHNRPLRGNEAISRRYYPGLGHVATIPTIALHHESVCPMFRFSSQLANPKHRGEGTALQNLLPSLVGCGVAVIALVLLLPSEAFINYLVSKGRFSTL